MLIQICTSCIELALFLYKMRVLGIESAMCWCREGDETPEHVTLWCPEEENRDKLQIKELGERGRLRFRQLHSTPEGAPRISRWLIKTGRLRLSGLVRILHQRLGYHMTKVIYICSTVDTSYLYTYTYRHTINQLIPPLYWFSIAHNTLSPLHVLLSSNLDNSNWQLNLQMLE